MSTAPGNFRGPFNVGPKGARFYQAGMLVEEKTRARRRLRFLYRSFLGRIVRLVFRTRVAAWIYALWQHSIFSRRAIKPFVRRYSVNLDDFQIPERGFRSFNDFFVRRLKQDARPVDEDRDALVAPTDSKVFMVSDLDGNDTFSVKGIPFDVGDFLGDPHLGRMFEGGTLLLFRLAPYDYHRYHAPVDCMPGTPGVVHGRLESVNPLVYAFGYMPLTTNERDVVELAETPFGGLVLVSVGAMFVGKIVHTFVENRPLKKGSELGYFAFGGSTLALLAQQGVMTVRDDIRQHSADGFETAVQMGERIATRARREGV